MEESLHSKRIPGYQILRIHPDLDGNIDYTKYISSNAKMMKKQDVIIELIKHNRSD